MSTTTERYPQKITALPELVNVFPGSTNAVLYFHGNSNLHRLYDPTAGYSAGCVLWGSTLASPEESRPMYEYNTPEYNFKYYEGSFLGLIIMSECWSPPWLLQENNSNISLYTLNTINMNVQSDVRVYATWAHNDTFQSRLHYTSRNRERYDSQSWQGYEERWCIRIA